MASSFLASTPIEQQVVENQQHNHLVQYRQQYDPNVFIQAADDKLAQDDLAGGQMIFQSALLDWVDDAREQQQQQQLQQQSMSGATATNYDPEQMREAIATLWLAYAQFLIKAKQYKSATEAYEQAVNCPIAGSVGRIWLDYARFAQERGKVRTAQNIYLRALVGNSNNKNNGATEDAQHSAGAVVAAVTDEQERQILWAEFLELMQNHNDPTLTMERLQEAAQNERMVTPASELVSSNLQQQQPDQVMSNSILVKGQNSTPDAAPPSKRPKLTADSTIETQGATTSYLTQQQQQQQQVSYQVTPEAVELETANLLPITQPDAMPPEITAAWILRDGSDAATIPEPPLFSPSPPKLSDTSGKDLLGDELALALIQRLLAKSGSIVLHVCQGLWTLTALKEQESKRALEHLDTALTAQFERLDATLEARSSVAGAAATAVAQMNERERASFLQDCQQQRQNLLQRLAWEFRQLLWQQQHLLTVLKVPGFDGPTVDQSTLELQASVCSCLHSAFYLRTRVGQESHEKMLKSQEERLDRDMVVVVSSSSSPKQGSRTPPTNRSPLTTRPRSAPTPPPIQYNTMFPTSNNPAPSIGGHQHPMHPQLLPAPQQATMYSEYMTPPQPMQVPQAYFNYIPQQQQPPPSGMQGVPPPAHSYPPSSFGQYPPSQYF